MDVLETTLAILFAAVLIAVAVFFAWRQRLTMRSLRGHTEMPRDQRRYLLKQTGRRLFGSFLMLVLAAFFVGSVFLDYEPMKVGAGNEPISETAKQAVRFISLYWMTLLVIVMIILALAVFDLWATARFGVQQRKQLAQEHQSALEAELARLRQRRAELN